MHDRHDHLSATDAGVTTAYTAGDRNHLRVAAGLLVAGAVGANAAFLGLGSTFEYPDVLQLPAAEIVARFDATQATTMAWFALLALSAGALGPAAVLLRRAGRGPAARWSAVVGVAAAVVQVIGLSRWLVLVPGLADRALDQTAPAASRADALDAFHTAHTWLGTALGETAGYALTALWTVLLLAALGRLPGWVRALGAGSAALIASGVLIPLDVPGTDLANFVGYVLWSVWLVALAVCLVRRRPAPPDAGVAAVAVAAAAGVAAST